MKKLKLFFFLQFIFLSFYCSAYSQNLKETLQWIKVALETDTYSFATFSSDSTLLIITDESGKIAWNVRQIIPLKKIQSVQFVQDSDIVRLELKCTSEKCVELDVKAKDQLEWRFLNNAVFASILFKNSVDENMRKRIVKAFNHLIILQGGSILDNTF